MRAVGKRKPGGIAPAGFRFQLTYNQSPEAKLVLQYQKQVLCSFSIQLYGLALLAGNLPLSRTIGIDLDDPFVVDPEN